MCTRTLLALALVLVLGCDSSDKSKKGDAGADGVIDSAPAASTCPSNLVGTWKMSFVFCGDADVTEAIRSQGGISAMTIDIRDNGVSCTVVGTTSGPTCTETEELALSSNGTGAFTVTGKGITDCQPAQCVFNANDAPCALGDRASAANVASLSMQDGTLTVTSQPPAGMCSGYGQVTTIRYAR